MNESFVQVGAWSAETNYLPLCSSTKTCPNILSFNTINSKTPESLPPYTTATFPQYIKLGGLFNAFSFSDGSINLAHVEKMHAFLMAVRHINDKHDGIYDDILPNTTIVIKNCDNNFNGGAIAMSEMFVGFGGSGVHAVVGGLDNDATVAMDRMNINHKIVQIHSTATTAEFGDGSTYHYNAQTSPIDPFEAIVIQSLLCNKPFNIKKVGLFTTVDFLGTKSVYHMNACLFCCLDILSTSYVYTVQDQDFSIQLNEARSGGAIYFVFFLPPYVTARIIEQGFEMGVFKVGLTQFFGTSLNTNTQIFQYFMYGVYLHERFRWIRMVPGLFLLIGQRTTIHDSLAISEFNHS